MDRAALRSFKERLGKEPSSKLGRYAGTNVPKRPPEYHRGFSDGAQWKNMAPKRVSWYLRGFIDGTLHRFILDDTHGCVEVE